MCCCKNKTFMLCFVIRASVCFTCRTCLPTSWHLEVDVSCVERWLCCRLWVKATTVWSPWRCLWCGWFQDQGQLQPLPTWQHWLVLVRNMYNHLEMGSSPFYTHILNLQLEYFKMRFGVFINHKIFSCTAWMWGSASVWLHPNLPWHHANEVGDNFKGSVQLHFWHVVTAVTTGLQGPTGDTCSAMIWKPQ